MPPPCQGPASARQKKRMGFSSFHAGATRTRISAAWLTWPGISSALIANPSTRLQRISARLLAVLIEPEMMSAVFEHMAIGRGEIAPGFVALANARRGRPSGRRRPRPHREERDDPLGVKRRQSGRFQPLALEKSLD